MSDSEDEEGPVVELGTGPSVEGAPLARVSSRLTWPIQRDRIDELEGDSVIRTPDGPRELSGILPELDDSYFGRRQDFESAVRDAVGDGPVPTEGDEGAEDPTDGAETEADAVETDAEEASEGEGAESTGESDGSDESSGENDGSTGESDESTE